MKKKIIAIILSVLCVSGCLCGCNEHKPKLFRTGYDYFEDIENGLIYSVDTKIVYYKVTTYAYKIMVPYYSENGKLCRYIDGNIDEIE